MQRSEAINELAAALAKAQGLIKGALKDQTNPDYKSKYADLAAHWEAIRGPFSANGLSIMQFPRLTEEGVEIETLLSHSSGQWTSEILKMPVPRADAQGVGSAITYARRYALSAIAGTSPDDDDGQAAAKSQQQNNSLKTTALAALDKAAAIGREALDDAWKGLTTEARKLCKDELPRLKETALAVGGQ